MTRISTFLFALLLGTTLATTGCGAKEPGKQTVSTEPAAGQPANPKVLIETSKGNITIELFAGKAPASVENFLSHVKTGFYDGTVFHRVIPGFMIQGGGMLPDMTEKSRGAPIRNEANNGLKNLRGTLAMARTNDPNSAAAQFFINVEDNDFLDYTSATAQGYGYCVFGMVTNGREVVDSIRKVRTGMRAGHQDVPAENVVIEKAVEV